MSKSQDVREGEEVSQTISFDLGETRNHYDFVNSLEPTIIEIGAISSHSLPKIGLGTETEPQLLAPRELNLLMKMGISHVRGDLDMQTESWRTKLQALCGRAKQLETGLELAVFVDDEAEEKLHLLREELGKLGESTQINTILVFDKGELATKPDTVEQARWIFDGYHSHPMIGGGTDRNYYDLDFTHPAMQPDSIVSYSVNPQVHAFDVSSLVETLEGQSWTVHSSHKVVGKNWIAVSPITLKPRFNPDEIVPESKIPNESPFTSRSSTDVSFWGVLDGGECKGTCGGGGLHPHILRNNWLARCDGE